MVKKKQGSATVHIGIYWKDNERIFKRAALSDKCVLTIAYKDETRCIARNWVPSRRMHDLSEGYAILRRCLRFSNIWKPTPGAISISPPHSILSIGAFGRIGITIHVARSAKGWPVEVRGRYLAGIGEHDHQTRHGITVSSAFTIEALALQPCDSHITGYLRTRMTAPIAKSVGVIGPCPSGT
jgi:hypothetical protein